MAAIFLMACSSSEPEPPKIPSDDNSLTVIYSSFGTNTALDALGTEVILSFSSNTDNYTNAAIVLVVHEAATLSNAERSFTLTPTNESRGTYSTTHDFSADKTYSYTVTAEDGTSSQTYTLKAQIQDDNSKKISSFIVYASSNRAAGVTQDIRFVLNEANKTISNQVTNVTVTGLVPTISHNGKSVSPASGVAQNFSTDLTYTVTALNNSTVDYTVTLNPYYSVVFDANEGWYPKEGASVFHKAKTNYVVFNTGVKVITNELTRPHYGFNGWSLTKDGAAAFDFSSPITNVTTLYARWTNYRYTLTFDVDGSVSNAVVDSLSELSSVAPGSACIATWYANVDYSEVYPMNRRILSNTTIYASSSEAMGRLIVRGTVPNSINEITSPFPEDQERWRSIMRPYIPSSAGATITFRYATEEGIGGLSGDSWRSVNIDGNFGPGAWPKNAILDNLNEMSGDPSRTNIYVIAIAGGVYTPVTKKLYTGAESDLSFQIPSYTAIVGGIRGVFPDVCAPRSTVFSGDVGTQNLATDNSRRIFYNHAVSNSVLYGATITGGYNNNTGILSGGAGMYNNAGVNLHLIKVVFSKNTVVNGLGGGLQNRASSVNLVDVSFFSNTANLGGAGLYNWYSGNVALTKVNFIGNEITSFNEGKGGGMYNSNVGVALTNVNFIENSSQHWGGGMFNDSGTDAILTEVNFINNKSVSSDGGGMYNRSVGTIPTTVLLNRATFSGNTAKFGGGIGNQSAKLTVINTTLFENEATAGEGGGLYNSAGATTPVLIGTTFFSNTARGGGGMFSRNFHMVNTLFWGNVATENNGSQILILNETVTTNQVYYSLVQGGFVGTLTGNSGNDIGGGFGAFTTNNISEALRIYVYTHNGASATVADILSGDPLLGSLANNGGSVETVAIGDGAAANTGIYVRRSVVNNVDTYYYSTDNNSWFTLSRTGVKANVTPPAGAVNLTATDARGYTRSGRPDIGAHESGGTQ